MFPSSSQRRYWMFPDHQSVVAKRVEANEHFKERVRVYIRVYQFLKTRIVIDCLFVCICRIRKVDQVSLY